MLVQVLLVDVCLKLELFYLALEAFDIFCVLVFPELRLRLQGLNVLLQILRLLLFEGFPSGLELLSLALQG